MWTLLLVLALVVGSASALVNLSPSANDLSSIDNKRILNRHLQQKREHVAPIPDTPVSNRSIPPTSNRPVDVSNKEPTGSKETGQDDPISEEEQEDEANKMEVEENITKVLETFESPVHSHRSHAESKGKGKLQKRRRRRRWGARRNGATPPADSEDLTKTGRVEVVDVKVDGDVSSHNKIALWVQTNSNKSVDILCHAFPAKMDKLPRADAKFIACKKCWIGGGTDCTESGCDVNIYHLEANRQYKIWCLPKGQPENLEDGMAKKHNWKNRPIDSDIFPQDPAGIPWKTERVDPTKVHKMIGFENFLGAGLMIIYIWWSFSNAAASARGSLVVHESAIVVVFGLLLGAVLKFVFEREMDFSYNVFSYYLLPMVIFSAGFQMKSNDMFKQAWHIGSLGLLATALSFLGILTTLALVTKFTSRERLILASALCATDTIAALAFVPPALQPVAHSVILGEGILNDITAVLISTTLGASDHHPSPGAFMYKCVYFASMSTLVGVAFGLGVTFFIRKSKLQDSIRTVTMIFLLNYCCYAFAETCDISSIMALFVSSMISGRYAWKELPSEPRRVAKDMAEMLGMSADSVVYGYFGLASWGYVNEMQSMWDMTRPVLLLTSSMIVQRLLLVFGFNQLIKWGFRMCRKDDRTLNIREGFLVSIGGMMRGSIASALVLKNIPPVGMRTHPDQDVASMCNKVVIFNTLFFAVLAPFCARKLVSKGI